MRRRAVLTLTALLLGWAVVVAPQAPAPAPLFVTADRCMGCHNQLAGPGGEDVSFGFDWRASMMADSARDPYWQAAVRREVADHPESAAAIEDECSTCHMPMATTSARAAGRPGGVFTHLPAATAFAAAPMARLAADGVSCAMCHQIEATGLGGKESFTGGFVVDTAAAPGLRSVFGPFAVDGGRRQIMGSATGFDPGQAAHIQSSELCATCHTLITHSLGPGGEVVGELPEQVPYLEWRHSEYGREERSCQSCHMPELGGETAVTSVLGQARAQVSRHVFRGGNFLMPLILNRHRGELGVAALPQELTAVSQRSREHLETEAAGLEVAAPTVGDGVLTFEVVVANRAGHKLPTAYPSRRAWLHVEVRDGDGRSVFESGRFEPDGSIRGNDNDEDAVRYEPHWSVIERPDQVQIYEAIMEDPEGRVTTGLLTAVRYVKDNRLLPAGFDKATAASEVAVHGEAADDADFTAGGDRLTYRVPLGGARGRLEIVAELWYQPIAYRWAHNLAGYDLAEPRRFVGYFEELAGVSGVVLARAAGGAAVE